MTEDDLRKKLVGFILLEYGTGAEAARQWGVGRAYVSAVMTGRKPIPEWMLNKIGYARKIVRIGK